MLSTTPKLTDAGKALLLRAVEGESVNFTRIAIGDGELGDGQDQDELTALISEKLSFSPVSIDSSQPGLVAISVSFGSDDVNEEFTWREFGLFAKGEDNVEWLYAYSNDGDDGGVLRPQDTDYLIEQKVTLIVEVDDAENIGGIYAPGEDTPDMLAHMTSTNNPHNVTKAQVGLGNVPNSTPSNMTVNFAIAYTTLDFYSGKDLQTGASLSTLFGRVAWAVHAFLGHIREKNPHNVTKAQVGLSDVQNSSPENMTVSFQEAATWTNITTGEKLGVMLGKIKKAITDTAAHIAATSGNPHGVTASDVGLGNVANTAPDDTVVSFEEAATFANIASGEKFNVMFGKIMKAISDLSTHIGDTTGNPHGVKLSQIADVGTYTGDGTQGRTVSLTFDPSAVLVYDEFGRTYNDTNGVCGGLATGTRGIRVPNSLTADDTTTWDNSFSALMCVTGGFKVNYYSGATAEDSIDTNENGVVYHYIAYK